jgi:hypothetical protein
MAAFMHYWRLTPAEVDALPDELMGAMVQLMQRHADALLGGEQ